jgi:hypothetical protein
VLAKPFPERMRLVARSWAAQVQPNSRAILATYWLKYFLVYIGGGPSSAALMRIIPASSP